MKILHVGNPEAFKNFAICNYFLQRGHEIHYFSPKQIKKWHPGIVYHHDPSIDSSKIGILKNILFLRKIIKNVKPDLVHAHNVNTYGWMATLAGARPLVVHAYGGDVLKEQMQGQKKYQYFLSRNTVRRADRIVVTGKHMVQSVASNFKIETSKIEVISRGVDLNIFTSMNSETKKRLRSSLFGISDNKIILLSPRYLFNSVYNIDVILKAVSLLKKDHPEIMLLQMHNHGKEDSIFQKTINLIKELDLQDCIRLLPLVPNIEMAEIYNISDICISVPHSDGFPVTVLEASACCVPMIVSNLPYASEWFKNNENGLIVETGSVEALTEAIKDLIINPHKRIMFADANLKQVRENADYILCMQKLEKLYVEVISK